jgi:deoxyribodipyrimidine photo-lyase
VAELVHEFARGALQDAAARAEAPGAPAFSGDAPDAVIDWAVSAGIETLNVMHTPYGPSADVLAALGPRLANAGVQLQAYGRDWDRRAWPYANRGFFKLRKRIPALLEAAGVTGSAHA